MNRNSFIKFITSLPFMGFLPSAEENGVYTTSKGQWKDGGSSWLGSGELPLFVTLFIRCADAGYQTDHFSLSDVEKECEKHKGQGISICSLILYYPSVRQEYHQLTRYIECPD